MCHACCLTCQNFRSEVDARLGAPQVFIKQVILYHELECNYDETRVHEEGETRDGVRVIDHTPASVRVVSEENLLTESKAVNIEWIKKSKSKSKSQLSLSTLEINVLFCCLFFSPANPIACSAYT